MRAGLQALLSRSIMIKHRLGYAARGSNLRAKDAFRVITETPTRFSPSRARHEARSIFRSTNEPRVKIATGSLVS